MKYTSQLKTVIFTLIGNLSILNQTYTQGISKDLEALFRSKFDEERTGASILISKKGKVIYIRQFGYANIEQQVAVDENTKFVIGSITKQFKTAAILLL